MIQKLPYFWTILAFCQIVVATSSMRATRTYTTGFTCIKHKKLFTGFAVDFYYGVNLKSFSIYCRNTLQEPANHDESVQKHSVGCKDTEVRNVYLQCPKGFMVGFALEKNGEQVSGVDIACFEGSHLVVQVHGDGSGGGLQFSMCPVGNLVCGVDYNSNDNGITNIVPRCCKIPANIGTQVLDCKLQWDIVEFDRTNANICEPCSPNAVKGLKGYKTEAGYTQIDTQNEWIQWGVDVFYQLLVSDIPIVKPDNSPEFNKVWDAFFPNGADVKTLEKYEYGQEVEYTVPNADNCQRKVVALAISCGHGLLYSSSVAAIYVYIPNFHQ